VLNDQKGDDRYECFQLAQGLGETKGCGLLLNLGDHNTYTANDTQIDFPSSQTPQHNTSMVQGCGFGRRADFGDGFSLAGGIGMLINTGSYNQYSCGLFGQGASYWYSLGMLVDLGGHASYAGVWYVQGSAVHHSVATLRGEKGNNTYKALKFQSIGHGKDNSIGLLHDLSGDSIFESEDFSEGQAWYNAIGILWVGGGKNAFRFSEPLRKNAMGEAHDCDAGVCVGLLIDEGGKSTFPADEQLAKPNSFWVRSNHDKRCWGIGLTIPPSAKSQP